jgi:hypothetical protein
LGDRQRGDAVSTPVTADEARRLVLEPSDVELWSIGHSLDQNAPAFSDGVSTQLVACMLEVGEPENWDRTTRRAEKPKDLFRPYVTMPKDDGKTYRSWLPEDLADPDEDNVRAFAKMSKNDFVRARIFEILWSRFRKFEDANAAIEARAASAKLCDAEKDWPRLVRNMGRLTTLTLQLNARTRLDELAKTLDEAADKLVASTRPFSLPALADMVCHTLLAKAHGREAFTEERAKRWASLLIDIAARFSGDPHHGHDALMVLQAWYGRLGDEQAMNAIRRTIVEHLRDIGRKSDAVNAPSFYERALRAALDFGISDLSEAVRSDLMGSIQESIPTFKQTSGTFTLPPKVLAEIEKVLATNPRLPGAIRQLSLLPGLLEVDVAHLRASTMEQLKDHPLLAFIPTVHYHQDGKITFRSNDLDGNVEGHVAFLVGSHLAFVEAILRYVLAQVGAGFEPQTLIESLAAWPHLPAHRTKLLAIAAERFARGDWVSSGFIVIPLYEAVLRDLLRAGGYPASKAEPGGVLMDETLNSLIRCAATRSILGDGHCDLVEHVMCNSALGWNLRNEIAHGTIRPETLTPMRVFLAWLLLVRLTCFVARPPAVAGPKSESTAADGTVP